MRRRLPGRSAPHLRPPSRSTAWDGEWYRRAYFDDGTPLGSRENAEAWIDSIAQSWAVISGAARPGAGRQAHALGREHLVREADRLVLLFTPPFEQVDARPRLHQGLPPGRSRERRPVHPRRALAGHGLRPPGRRRPGGELLSLLNPVEHARTPDAVERYRVEPYVVAADVYSLAGHVGQGGWTWYTGSAGWMYRVWMEEVLGMRLRGSVLQIDPVIPPTGRPSCSAAACGARGTRSAWRTRTTSATA